MPTHLYCLLPAGSSVVPPVPPAVRAIPAAGFIAWVGDSATDKLSRDLRDAARATIEHDRVVGAAIAQNVTPIPVSLADPYESDDAARIDISAHTAAIAAALGAVAGKIEMTTIIAVRDVPPAAGSEGRGRAYLERLRSVPARAAQIADRVATALTPIAGGAARRADGGRVALSHLIPRDRVEAYRAAAQRCSADGYLIVVDGPRAPYSFASFAPRRGIVGQTSISAA